MRKRRGDVIKALDFQVTLAIQLITIYLLLRLYSTQADRTAANGTTPGWPCKRHRLGDAHSPFPRHLPHPSG